MAEKNRYGMVICDTKCPEWLVSTCCVESNSLPGYDSDYFDGSCGHGRCDRAINDGLCFDFGQALDNRELVETVGHSRKFVERRCADDAVEEEPRAEETLEVEHPGITSVLRDSRGAIVVSEE